MKRLLLLSLLSLYISACSQGDKDRFVFGEDRILDVETGDEYYLNKMDTLTIVNIEGETSEILATASPFADDEEFREMMDRYHASIAERKEKLLEEQKNLIKDQRIERYASYEDKELLEYFNRLHKEDAPYEQQMDVMAELVRREVVLEIDAATMLEVDTTLLDFDIDYTPTED
jgi:hypothetical protein